MVISQTHIPAGTGILKPGATWNPWQWRMKDHAMKHPSTDAIDDRNPESPDEIMTNGKTPASIDAGVFIMVF